MLEDINEVMQYMGWFPCFEYPEKIMEDEVFVYYKFSVPYEEDEEGLILGVRYFPVYVGVESLGEDEEFKYFKCRVPKIFLETISPTLGVPYGIMFEEEKLEGYRTEIETKALDANKRPGISIAAGVSLPDSPKSGTVGENDLDGLNPKKKQFEIVLRCKSELCGYVHTEITSDVWRTIFGAVCGHCLGNFEIEKCEEVGCGDPE